MNFQTLQNALDEFAATLQTEADADAELNRQWDATSLDAVPVGDALTTTAVPRAIYQSARAAREAAQNRVLGLLVNLAEPAPGVVIEAESLGARPPRFPAFVRWRGRLFAFAAGTVAADGVLDLDDGNLDRLSPAA